MPQPGTAAGSHLMLSGSFGRHGAAKDPLKKLLNAMRGVCLHI